MKSRIFLLLIFVLPLVAKAQIPVYMPYMEIIGMHPDYQYSLSKLFKTYVNDKGEYKIILPKREGEYYEAESLNEARDSARNAGAAYFIIIEMNRLGEVVVANFNMYDVAEGKKTWNDMLKANTPDDLDPILMRVAANMGTEVKASDEMDIYTVTDYESKELNQIRANYAFGVSVGGFVPFTNEIDRPFSSGFGMLFTYDTRNLILNINGEMYFRDVNVYYLSLEGLYPFSEKKSTPYVMGGLGFGGMTVRFVDNNPSGSIYHEETSSDGGLMLFAGAGYIINRTSNVNLRLGIKGLIPTYSVDGKTIPGILFSVAIVRGRRW